MTFSGRRIVVIGGSSGMGLATAHAAAAAGAAVTIASSDRGRLDAALAQLPDTCDGAVVNTRNEADIAALFDRVEELDHVVYTAGDAVRPQPLVDLALDAARDLFEVRFWGTVATVKRAAPLIRPGGSIVLTSGTVAVRPAPGTALAAAGAAATEGLTRGLAAELAPVRVNAVRAGAIRTPLWDPVPEPQRAALFAALADRTLTKSIGEADQIAAAHLYLMENRFVTGTVLSVDGGAVLA
ncbi:SDR family oxidoreductase [Streptomyces fuscichromogenes]|uniref:Short-chain dehydrogenase n=1 Tax=Streptomyces fuscichromogenes TaxID=1324013 RepID=A0A917UJZ9_9ACTN|nr:SDR family oxidoreductase [Streptomyces fuscichromogenes]GGM96926.1 short-chain dehydrogenase [Streptomyces fuscichromogenes]